MNLAGIIFLFFGCAIIAKFHAISHSLDGCVSAFLVNFVISFHFLLSHHISVHPVIFSIRYIAFNISNIQLAQKSVSQTRRQLFHLES